MKISKTIYAVVFALGLMLLLLTACTQDTPDIPEKIGHHERDSYIDVCHTQINNSVQEYCSEDFHPILSDSIQ